MLLFIVACADALPEPGRSAEREVGAMRDEALELTGVGRLTIPAGAFTSSQRVELATTDPLPERDFRALTAVFGDVRRGSYEVRIRAPVRPIGALRLELEAPQELGRPEELVLFASGREEGDLDQSNRLSPRSAMLTGGRLTVEVEPLSFVDLDEGGLEASFILSLPLNPRDTPPSLGQSRTSSPLTGSRRDELESCPPGVGRFRSPIEGSDPRKPCSGGNSGNGCRTQAFRETRILVVNPTTGMPVIDPATGQQKVLERHPGLDLRAPDGTPLVAVKAGVVVEALDSNGEKGKGDNGGTGGTVVIELEGGARVQYMHMKKGAIVVEKGTRVEAGQVIGLSNNSGFSKDPHLHFELRPFGEGKRISPDRCIGTPSPWAGTMRSESHYRRDWVEGTTAHWEQFDRVISATVESEESTVAEDEGDSGGWVFQGRAQLTTFRTIQGSRTEDGIVRETVCEVPATSADANGSMAVVEVPSVPRYYTLGFGAAFVGTISCTSSDGVGGGVQMGFPVNWMVPGSPLGHGCTGLSEFGSTTPPPMWPQGVPVPRAVGFPLSTSLPMTNRIEGQVTCFAGTKAEETSRWTFTRPVP
ncbi:MAG: M23 family metallopeptidase [Myxococcaceae bacterium]|nr:M23 family metallopeptidase [Myxococcaceae bacterium]